MQKIIDALTLQKREKEDSLNKKYVPRFLKLIDLDMPITKVIIGPRRAGKSFFALHEASRIPGFGYLNFDDETLHKVDDYNLLVESARIVYSNSKTLLLDEVQNLKDWELFINRLQRQNYNLIITGSNSKLLSRELSTHLTGRYLSFIIPPFSFEEYLRFFAAELTTPEKRACYVDYSQKGGFPEPLVKNLEYKNYLDSLYDSLLYKDITLRHNIKSPQALQALASYLVTNNGNLISYSRLARLTQIRSIHTITKYIDFLEEAFLFFTVRAFSYKRKEQIKSPKKIFTIDNGFAYARSGAFSPNIGKLCENLAAIELKKGHSRDISSFTITRIPRVMKSILSSRRGHISSSSSRFLMTSPTKRPNNEGFGPFSMPPKKPDAKNCSSSQKIMKPMRTLNGSALGERFDSSRSGNGSWKTVRIHLLAIEGSEDGEARFRCRGRGCLRHHFQSGVCDGHRDAEL